MRTAWIGWNSRAWRQNAHVASPSWPGTVPRCPHRSQRTKRMAPATPNTPIYAAAVVAIASKRTSTTRRVSTTVMGRTFFRRQDLSYRDYIAARCLLRRVWLRCLLGLGCRPRSTRRIRGGQDQRGRVRRVVEYLNIRDGHLGTGGERLTNAQVADQAWVRTAAHLKTDAVPGAEHVRHAAAAARSGGNDAAFEPSHRTSGRPG